ncbi:hypothetical protein ACWGB8_08580 [Kitasatospora sp. NPDC054939]
MGRSAASRILAAGADQLRNGERRGGAGHVRAVGEQQGRSPAAGTAGAGLAGPGAGQQGAYPPWPRQGGCGHAQRGPETGELDHLGGYPGGGLERAEYAGHRERDGEVQGTWP